MFFSDTHGHVCKQGIWKLVAKPRGRGKESLMLVCWGIEADLTRGKQKQVGLGRGNASWKCTRRLKADRRDILTIRRRTRKGKHYLHPLILWVKSNHPILNSVFLCSKCWKNYNATGYALLSNYSIQFITLKLRRDQCALSPSNISQAFSFQTEKYHRRRSVGIYGLIKPLCVLCKCDYYRSLSVYKTMYYKCLGQPPVFFLQRDRANGKRSRT